MPDRNSLWEERTVWFGLKQSPLWQGKHDIWIDLADGDGSLQMAIQWSQTGTSEPGLGTETNL